MFFGKLLGCFGNERPGIEIPAKSVGWNFFNVKIVNEVLAKEEKMIAGTYIRKVYNSPYECDGTTTKATKRAKILSGLRAHKVNVFFEVSRSLNNGNDEPLRGKACHELVSP